MNHQQIDARSLAMHELIARKIRQQPELFDKVLPTILRWRGLVDKGTLPYLDRWERIVRQGMDAALKKATEDSEDAAAMRQSAPFAGILTPQERFAFLRDWKNRHVPTHAHDRAARHGRAYAPSMLDHPPEGGASQPESVLDEQNAA